MHFPGKHSLQSLLRKAAASVAPQSPVEQRPEPERLPEPEQVPEPKERPEESPPTKLAQHRILLACAPKSGSSFLSSILENLPGFKRARLMSLSERREQELCPVMLEAATALNSSFVAQQHLRYSLMTEYYIKKYRLKPVVQVRSIFDLVVSFRDHIGGGHQRRKARRATYQPMAAVPIEYREWSDDRQSEFVAKLVAPWYFNFYVNWIDREEKFLVTYEDLIADPGGTVGRIAQFWELDVTPEEINQAVEAARAGKIRLNVGKSGRGDQLPTPVRDHILSLASFYEGVDLTPLGLPPR